MKRKKSGQQDYNQHIFHYSQESKQLDLSDSNAVADDGNCEFEANSNYCVGDLDNDGFVITTDLLIMLGAFGNECEQNL